MEQVAGMRLRNGEAYKGAVRERGRERDNLSELGVDGMINRINMVQRLDMDSISI
jgi:hypothetical protein